MQVSDPRVWVSKESQSSLCVQESTLNTCPWQRALDTDMEEKEPQQSTGLKSQRGWVNHSKRGCEAERIPSLLASHSLTSPSLLCDHQHQHTPEGWAPVPDPDHLDLMHILQAGQAVPCTFEQLCS